MTTTDAITRREALRQTALLVGGTLAASTIAAGERAVWAATPKWEPRTLTAQQLELVATLAEHIIPATDTPGARAAGVHRLVDVLLTDFYGREERDRFLTGLGAVDSAATRTYGAPFLRCSAREQLELITGLDREAYPPDETSATAAPREAETQKMKDSLARAGSTTAPPAAPSSAARTGPRGNEVRDEFRPGWFFRRMKELAVLGYYTSAIGATKELRLSPWGAYHGDIPYRRVGRGWA